MRRRSENSVMKTLWITCIALLGYSCHAFTTNTNLVRESHRISTKLHIIGPMIRKFREDRAKKEQPLASLEERSIEAPGLKVGTGVWKWPPVWPYDGQAFMRKSEIIPVNPTAPMAGLLAGGMPSLPTPSSVDVKPLDVLKYWGEDVGDVLTDIDLEAADRLRK